LLFMPVRLLRFFFFVQVFRRTIMCGTAPQGWVTYWRDFQMKNPAAEQRGIFVP
jgi:hypothetical protein